MICSIAAIFTIFVIAIAILTSFCVLIRVFVLLILLIMSFTIELQGKSLFAGRVQLVRRVGNRCPQRCCMEQRSTSQ
jgi:hypothetical protein